MGEQFDCLYHLTNIDRCGEILRSGKICPRIQGIANCTDVEKCALDPGRFVHFNFCTRSLMLWLVYQGRCPSAYKIWGQKDAVHIEISSHVLWNTLNLLCDKSCILSDYDFSDKRRNAIVLNLSEVDDVIGNFLDASEINLTVTTINVVEHPKKGAELMVDMEVPLNADMVSSIGVFDEGARDRLLQKQGISQLYADKISVRSEWYF